MLVVLILLLLQIIYTRNIEGVKSLVKKSQVDINKRHGENQFYPIELAVPQFFRAPDLETLKLLWQEGGADVNVFSSRENYDSALAAACASRGSQVPELLQCFLDAGAEVDKQLRADEYGSALAVAAKESHGTEIMQALIDAGADVKMPMENGKYDNALMAAQAGDSGDYSKIAFLLRAGAKMEYFLKPEAYRGAISAAFLANKPEKVKVMVKTRADVNITLNDSDFGDFLAYSTILDFEGILKPLIAGGASADQPISTGRYGTALIAAACFGQYQASECLIKPGSIVDMECLNGDYRSPKAASAPSSEADRAYAIKFCNSNEIKAAKLLEKWGNQKKDAWNFSKRGESAG
ncbi:hypothetical protein N7475_000261 [Penicillium sp. IBT 31633x]|nr:hypothetical protein N7475_000261 [Penicillium sp. IBT 31633x]